MAIGRKAVVLFWSAAAFVVVAVGLLEFTAFDISPTESGAVWLNESVSADAVLSRGAAVAREFGMGVNATSDLGTGRAVDLHGSLFVTCAEHVAAYLIGVNDSVGYQLFAQVFESPSDFERFAHRFRQELERSGRVVDVQHFSGELSAFQKWRIKLVSDLDFDQLCRLGP